VPWHQQKHGDPFWRLYWFQADGARLHYGGETLPLPAGRLHLVPPGCVYTCISPVAQRHLFIHMELQPVPLAAQRDCFPAPFSLPPARLSDSAGQLDRLLHAGQCGDPLALSLQARGLAAGALGCAIAALPRARRHMLRNLLEGRDPIRPAVLAIAADPTYPWRIGDLAGRCGLSPRGFHAACRRSLGMSPSRYVQVERLRRAAAVLLTSTAGVEQIAFDCGFYDRAHFTRQFRRHFNTTPHAYRRAANLLIARPR
jgi:AraC-like DNA-binding protein